MSRVLLLYFTIFLSLSAKIAATPQTQEDAIEAEVVQEALNNQEQTYNDPRGILRYDDASQKPVPIAKETISNFKEDELFNYKEALPEDTWWTRFKQKINDIYRAFIRWLTGGNEASGVWRVIVEVLPYLLLLGFITLIVWIFTKMDSGTLLMEKINAPETALSNDEELINRKDLQELIDHALSNGNYRLAVRFYYLLILQKMSSQNLIEWQVQKTNHDYIYELEHREQRDHFTKVTAIYDYIWYGNFEVDKNAFAKAETSFKKMSSLL